MGSLHFPWLEFGILLPLLGAVWTQRQRDPDVARRDGLIITGLALVCMIGAWVDFKLIGAPRARDPWGPLSWLSGGELVALDDLNAPLTAMGALIYYLTILGTLRTKAGEFSISRTLFSESILLATFAAATPWGLVAMMAIGVLPPYVELVRRRRPSRVYLAHMGLFVVLLILGEYGVSRGASPGEQPLAPILLLIVATLLRSGVAPVHCWMTDLFEHATFGRALLFVTPMVGAYGVTRLVLPIAPEWALEVIAILSLFTAIYAAGMALVQRESRRFFCYLFLSHSSLVLVGIETATPVGLTGSLCLWLSASLSLTGFGLALRCVEARVGRSLMTEFHGLYEHIPMMAGLFLLSGLASIGFPGTAGFVGLELLVNAAARTVPFVGTSIVIVAALNGLAIIQAYFRIFAGPPRPTSIDLQIRPSERVAILIITALILGAGLYPQPGVSDRHQAATRILRARADDIDSHAQTRRGEPSRPIDRPGSSADGLLEGGRRS